MRALRATLVRAIVVLAVAAETGGSAAGKDCPPTNDRATGGGWLLPGGGERTFGFEGGLRENGSVHGHIVFKNHATDERLKGEVTAYVITGTNTRRLQGTGQSDGQETDFDLQVADNGKPGSGDSFTLAYVAPGGPRLESGTLGGGNIQIHTSCG
jgi:hypothetical protein